MSGNVRATYPVHSIGMGENGHEGGQIEDRKEVVLAAVLLVAYPLLQP